MLVISNVGWRWWIETRFFIWNLGWKMWWFNLKADALLWWSLTKTLSCRAFFYIDVNNHWSVVLLESKSWSKMEEFVFWWMFQWNIFWRNSNYIKRVSCWCEFFPPILFFGWRKLNSFCINVLAPLIVDDCEQNSRSNFL